MWRKAVVASHSRSADAAMLNALQEHVPHQEDANYTAACHEPLLKEKLKHERLLGEIEVLERRAKQDQSLHRLQQAKVARKPIVEARIAEIRTLLDTVMPVGPPPAGLDMACLAPVLAANALEELRPHFCGGTFGSKGSEVFEIGWSFYELRGDRTSQRSGTALAEHPHLQQLLAAAMEAFADDRSRDACVDDSCLNVICRRYSAGQSLGFHTDEPHRFEEDVYGCVLENTSEAMLQFRCRASGAVFFLQEAPGTCFRQRDEARYRWLHGIDPLTKGERFSVTWRWFRADFLDVEVAECLEAELGCAHESRHLAAGSEL